MGTRFNNVPPLTDEEEAEIQRQIASDPEAPEATDEQLAQAKPFEEALPDLYESIQRSRGRPKATDPLKPVTVRIPKSWLDEWMARGDDWRARMKERLRP